MIHVFDDKAQNTTYGLSILSTSSLCEIGHTIKLSTYDVLSLKCYTSKATQKTIENKFHSAISFLWYLIKFIIGWIQHVHNMSTISELKLFCVVNFTFYICSIVQTFYCSYFVVEWVYSVVHQMSLQFCWGMSLLQSIS